MAVTRRIPPERLQTYFDEFTKRFLRDGSPEAVDIELVAPVLGDQPAIMGGRLLGITYDPHDKALEFALDAGEHRSYEPNEVWVIEEPNGFISSLEIVTPEGAREVISVKQVGLRRIN